MKRAVWPASSPICGCGVAAPRNAGFVESAPRTTAHEWRSGPRFVHTTRTVQPRGTVHIRKRE